MNTANKISRLSMILLVLAAICLATNLILPIWKIDLYAPQYPEGLVLLIYADKLGGNVDIINGLNHYIGMQTLHAENFIEFTILKYILGFFSLCILVAAFARRKQLVYGVFIAFTLFSVLSMVDFYRWNYNYGHHLDPNAAIKVPGMSYQPPLIGYKQLLNFGAYSMPDTGGMLFITCGVLLLLVVLIERKVFAKRIKKGAMAVPVMLIAAVISMASCSASGPRPIKVNEDACAYCKMTITNPAFATELTTKKGRQYVFDDVACMVGFKKESTALEYDHFYVANFSSPADFVDLDHAILLQSDSLRSPMGGNMAGFASREDAQVYLTKYGASEISWTTLIK